MDVIRFPARSRANRERILDIAAKALPLLQAAAAEGNASLLREIFAVLGDVAEGADATGRLGAIRLVDAEVLPLVKGPS